MVNVPQIIREIASNLTSISTGQKVINIQQVLETALISGGSSPLESAELAEQWKERLKKEIEKQLQEWDDLGLPRPLLSTNNPLTLITYKHDKYVEKSKLKLPDDFSEVLDFINSLNPTEFLIVPLCLLAIANCNPIIITDATNDGGVDCIGKIDLGPTRCLCIFIQAKTSISEISKDILHTEESKFRDLQTKALFADYLAALGKTKPIDGRAICYAITANNEFQMPARDYALRINVLLRSRRQVAYWLSQYFGISNLEKMKVELSGSLKKDLNRNFMPELKNFFLARM